MLTICAWPLRLTIIINYAVLTLTLLHYIHTLREALKPGSSHFPDKDMREKPSEVPSAGP